ncbi:MAG: hypothetical protein ABI337_10010, partial [Nitrososphaera sp.]
FKDMVNHCIRIGLENNCTSIKNRHCSISHPKRLSNPIKIQTHCHIPGSRHHRRLLVEAVKWIVGLFEPLILRVDGS